MLNLYVMCFSKLDAVRLTLNVIILLLIRSKIITIQISTLQKQNALGTSVFHMLLQELTFGSGFNFLREAISALFHMNLYAYTDVQKLFCITWPEKLCT
jgi:hypothetical protein